MKYSLSICLIACILGAIIGYFLPTNIPAIYSKFFSVAILAGVESVTSALKLYAKNSFNVQSFIITFFLNIIVVISFIYLGGKLGLDLYYVVIIALGVRLLMNLDYLRYHIFSK